MKHYCKNGDIIRVGGVYEYKYKDYIEIVGAEIINGNEIINGDTGYPIAFITRELPRDIYGYYLWQGKKCPVPGEWLVEAVTLGTKYSARPATDYEWDYVSRFRVISTGEDVQEVEPSINSEQVNVQEGPEPSPEINMENTPEGYDDLAYVLVRALEQAALGKGKERHAEDKPFSEQPMQRLIDLYGTGFAFGQAGKKMQESQRMGHDAAIREILGAIVYAAGAIVSMERGE